MCGKLPILSPRWPPRAECKLVNTTEAAWKYVRTQMTIECAYFKARFGLSRVQNRNRQEKLPRATAQEVECVWALKELCLGPWAHLDRDVGLGELCGHPSDLHQSVLEFGLFTQL